VSRISPFVGLRFDVARVGPLDRVTSPPYDVISPHERRRLLAASPHNAIRLDLGEDEPGAEQDKYRRAGRELRRWREEGILISSPRPSYYPYEMRFSYHGRPMRTRGIVCLIELEEWGGSILPHEQVMQGPVDDRLDHLRALRANVSSIHTVFSGPCSPLADALDRATATEPLATTTDDEGVEHRLWAIEDAAGLAEAIEGVSLMIADGHHRYTTALRFRDEMRAEHGPGPWDRVMALVVDAATEDVPVLPYHRIVRTPPAPTGGMRVRDLEEILDTIDDEAVRYGVAAWEDDEVIHRVVDLDGDPPTVCALHRDVLRGRDDALSFTHDAVDAEQAARGGSARAAVFLPPTTAGRIQAVVERGDRLPQKSTFFWPKPRTGLVIRPLD
jgi:uncharacterized protein (DUF1015 family)